MQTIDELITSLEKGKEKFILTDEGDIDKFLGIEIQHFENGSFEISQPHLINRILQVLQLDKKNEWSTATKSRELPGTSILSKEPKGKPRKYEDRWNYRTAVSVGMLTHLQGNSRPDISVHVHQCARLELELQRQQQQQQQASTAAPAFALNTAQATVRQIDFTTKPGGRIEEQCNTGLARKLNGASGHQQFIKEIQANFKDGTLILPILEDSMLILLPSMVP
ncbi:hypothetical protein QTG54_003947 [Skeletonema marinoi]|uniref:Uncharacterized protein n=1 Tax=Skeletonema marinoi TaxID=267567 RepID=A0AAD9DHQ6_9STRA|nr:hypothetical protein QTG54_003947 [Skeletonema marinoi]